jgi:hypothetical protein
MSIAFPLSDTLFNSSVSAPLQAIARKALNRERISPEEGLLLFEQGEIGFLGALANAIREDRHGHHTFFNRNFHIEPTKTMNPLPKCILWAVFILKWTLNSFANYCVKFTPIDPICI